MSVIKYMWAGLLATALAGTAAAQDAGRAAAERQAGEAEAGRATQGSARAEEIEAQLREAEERLAEAAARVAELSTRRLPEVSSFVTSMRGMDRAVLGITIGTEGRTGPVEGVAVVGVTPGSPAAEAGLRAGDVITAINGESMSADDEDDANRKLLDFMAGVEEGDELALEYLRDGQAASVEVSPRKGSGWSFAWRGMSPRFRAPLAPQMGLAFFAGGSFGDMEMVPLTAGLGRYFGTDEGLLVVRAPRDPALALEDGDVIRSIDGREPTSVSHAMRILSSYQGGETLTLEIMRNQRQMTLTIEMPDGRQSGLPAAPAAPKAVFRSIRPGRAG